MDNNIKLFSEIEKYEIININDGEKYSTVSNNDIIIDDDGTMKTLMLSENSGRMNLFKKNDFLEISFDYVKKIGTRTIIIDVDEDAFKKSHL